MNNSFNRALSVSAIALVAAAALPASATTLTGWNTDNVFVPAANPADGITGESIVYDRDATDPGAISNGKIVFTPPEAVLPGLQTDNVPFELGGPNPKPVAMGCIRASNPNTACDGPFQSGKRFKQVITGEGPVDLVFDVDPDGIPDPTADTTIGYEVFHRLVNGTGRDATGFTVSLGFGVGDAFSASTAGDGLSFSTTFAAGPNGDAAFSQFPFGLFGDADTSPNHTLDGFFDTDMRSGFDVFLGQDTITSDGMYGAYGTLFGDLMPSSDVPMGAIWDTDGDPDTDGILMAWFDEDLGQWEIRRELDGTTPSGAAPLASSVLVNDFIDVANYLGLAAGTVLVEDVIEDLANMNLTYAIALDDVLATFDQFTLRVELDLAPVPLPMSAPLMAAALGGLALVRRKRRSA